MAIFEQIRSGASLEQLLSTVRDGDMLIGLSSPASIQQNADIVKTIHERRNVELAPLRTNFLAPNMRLPAVDRLTT